MNSFKTQQSISIYPYVATSLPLSITGSDYFINAAASGSFIVTLPTAVGRTGQEFVIQKTDAVNTASGLITINTTSSQTINGVTTTTLNTQYESLTIVSDGANWVARRYIPGNTVTFTPTGSWIANTTYTGKWRRLGDTMQIEMALTLAGAPTSAALTINLPSGFTIDTAKLATTGAFSHHGVSGAKQGGVSYNLTPFYNNTTSIGVAYVASATTAQQATVTEAAPITWGNLDVIQVMIQVPITDWKG